MSDKEICFFLVSLGGRMATAYFTKAQTKNTDKHKPFMRQNPAGFKKAVCMPTYPRASSRTADMQTAFYVLQAALLPHERLNTENTLAQGGYTENTLHREAAQKRHCTRGCTEKTLHKRLPSNLAQTKRIIK